MAAPPCGGSKSKTAPSPVRVEGAFFCLELLRFWLFIESHPPAHSGAPAACGGAPSGGLWASDCFFWIYAGGLVGAAKLMKEEKFPAGPPEGDVAQQQGDTSVGGWVGSNVPQVERQSFWQHNRRESERQ